MKNVFLEIVSNELVANNTYKMVLKGDLKEIKKSGEFIEIKLPNYYLRRPISVSDIVEDKLVLLYKVLGDGTKDMTSYPNGTKLDCLIGLGNGFDASASKKPLLVAGGIGIAPMFKLAKEFNSLGIMPTILYGAAKKADLALVSTLEKLGKLIICTDDGSAGYKGNVINYLENNEITYDYYYACGPQIMLKGLKNYSNRGYLSLEARMGCGFGACMGCSINTANGPKRVCKEGPVFKADEVIF